MLYPRINKTVSHSPPCILQKLIKPDRILKTQQTVGLQNRAYNNLCELSKTICEQQFDQIEQKLVLKKEKYSFSPWKWKSQDSPQKSQLPRAKKMLIQKAEKESKVEREQGYPIQNKENICIKRQSLKRSLELKKYPSIYLRLLKGKQMKSLLKMKKCDPEIELITCMKKKKSKKQLQPQNAQQKLTRHQTAKELIKYSPLKIQNDSKIRKREPTRFTLHEFSSGSILQPISKQIDNLQKIQIELQRQHWKAKAHSSKPRKQRLVTKSELENRNGKSRESKENIMVSKKGSVSFESEKKQNYHINNPLTRVLYEKYINTISVGYPNKGSKLKF